MDGKELFLRNAGDEKFPNLITERVFAEENPAAREHGTDRPGPGIQARRHQPSGWHGDDRLA